MAMERFLVRLVIRELSPKPHHLSASTTSRLFEGPPRPILFFRNCGKAIKFKLIRTAVTALMLRNDIRPSDGKKTLGSSRPESSQDRGDWIRTSDHLNPIQARYQAAPRPDNLGCNLVAPILYATFVPSQKGDVFQFHPGAVCRLSALPGPNPGRPGRDL